MGASVPATILICDDDELQRWAVAEHLQSQGFLTREAENGQICVEQVAVVAPACVILDLRMPVMDGLTALQRLREIGSLVPVIVVTSTGGVEEAIQATRLGAVGWLTKPFDLRELTLTIQRALEADQLKQEVHYLRDRERMGYGEFIGTSPSLTPVYEMLHRLESVDAPTVLILGESGSGKDVLARAIHARGPRREQVFMEVDCASLPETLIESELFGYERGAFTDARAMKRGLLESAAGGVVFLDEIGEMSPSTQAKLLRALENRTFKRVGGVTNLRMDCAVIAATNRDLRAEIANGRFREDLFFRLNVIPILIPPLRERKEDLGALIGFFLERFQKAFGKKVTGITGPAMEALSQYHWPGNVRELRNVFERIVILAQQPQIDIDHLPAEIRWSKSSENRQEKAQFILPDQGIDLEEIERSFLLQALEKTQGNRTQAAALLGISRHALRYRMEKFQLS
jgi:two-component system response regulator AtoC